MMTIKEANKAMKAIADKLNVSEKQDGLNLQTKNPQSSYYGTNGCFKPCYSFTSPFSDSKFAGEKVGKASYLRELEHLCNKFTTEDTFECKEFGVWIPAGAIQTLRYSQFIIYESRNRYRLSSKAFKYVEAVKEIEAQIQ